MLGGKAGRWLGGLLGILLSRTVVFQTEVQLTAGLEMDAGCKLLRDDFRPFGHGAFACAKRPGKCVIAAKEIYGVLFFHWSGSFVALSSGGAYFGSL